MRAWTALLGGLALLVAAAGMVVVGRGPDPALAQDGEVDDDGCVGCHAELTPGIQAHWKGSRHAQHDVTCMGCHEADPGELDAWLHEGEWIATVVTPRDCGTCHEREAEEFMQSHHAKGGNILHSLDNLLAETVEGHRGTFEVPHPHKPGEMLRVDGLSFAASGCWQCHGSQLRLESTDGGSMGPWTLEVPAGGGVAEVTFDRTRVNREKIARAESGRPIFDSNSWPNTGIGRLNLDGSRGSCSACHSRHDFSARRARKPENCGRCHMGPDHPQKEIFEESKHGIAYRDMIDHMNLDASSWVLGVDYSAAPTCATCHMSATRNQPVTHDPRRRIAWNNRPPISVRISTDDEGHQLPEGSPDVTQPWEGRREAMRDVCQHCHGPAWVDGFFAQYDDFVVLYNEKYARPGAALMTALKKHGLLTKPDFDEKVEWTWFYLWHHEGRRARMGASMMGPDYSHWHGTFEVAERWYQELVPEIREILDHARSDPAKAAGVEAVEDLLTEILSRPEHRYGAGAR